MKKGITKKLVSKILVPSTKHYLKKNRRVKFMDMDLQIPVGVFHPSLFFSTKTMCRFLSTQPLTNKNLLEIGCGSGAISIYAAKLGARVVGCDIHPLAVKTSQKNAELNGVTISIVPSDLFDALSPQPFDLIVCNPPYYPKDPVNVEEKAWYAGKHFDFFEKFFLQVKPFLLPHTTIYLVLSDECDQPAIDKIALKNSMEPKLAYERRHILEKSYIMGYTIRQ